MFMVDVADDDNNDNLPLPWWLPLDVVAVLIEVDVVVIGMIVDVEIL